VDHDDISHWGDRTKVVDVPVPNWRRAEVARHTLFDAAHSAADVDVPALREAMSA